VTSNIGRSVVWNTVGTMYYYACQWLITILAVRIGGYSLAGYLSLAMTITNSFYAIAQFGMRQFQVSDLEEKYSDTIYIGSRYISIFVAFVTCTIYLFLSHYSNVELACTMSYLLLRLVEAFVDVYHGIDQKNWRFDIIGKSLLVRGTILVLGFWIGLELIGDLPIVLLIITTLSLSIVIGYDIRYTKQFAEVKGTLKDYKIKRLLLECFPIVIFNFLLSTVTLIARDTLQIVEGVERLGVYASVASPAVIIQLLASVIFNPFVPLFTSYYLEKDNKKFCILLAKFILFLLTLLLIAMIGARFLGEWVLVLIIGSSIRKYMYLLLPVIVCTVVTAVIWLLSAVMIAIRKTKALLLCTVVGVLISWASSRVFVERYSMNGVSYVIIFSGIVQVILMLVCCLYTVWRNCDEE